MFTIKHVTVDCLDPYALATFWSTVTGWPVSDIDEPGDDEVAIEPTEPGVPELLFVRVPEAKAGKNRLHLDLAPVGRDQRAEVERLVMLGAKVLADPPDDPWIVLADPEGNEFCVLSPR